MGLFIAALATVMVASSLSATAYAAHKSGHENADDKNNPTFPGGGAGNDPPDHANNERAQENTADNCAKHINPAQCTFGDGKD